MEKTKGCFTIITNKKNQILLVKRKDYPLWDLPGGKVNENESLHDCAIRETLEETGYHIMIQYQIGTYHRPKFNDTQYIYLGMIEGGCPISNGPETKCLQWFPLHKMPFNLIPNRRKQIKHFYCGKKSIHYTLKDRHPVYLADAILQIIKK